MCFKNLPIEFDELGNARLKEGVANPYDYEVTENLRETGAGVLVPDARAFVEATVRLLTDDSARAELAAAATRAGRELDWDVLAQRFETEVLDRFLPS